MFYKKMIFIVLVLCCFSVQHYAQSPLKKGVTTLSGSVEGNYQKGTGDGNENKTYRFSFNPSYGCFVTDNILINGFLSFNYYENKYISNSGYTSTWITRSIDIGPDIRYYFNQIKIIPFIGAGFSYSKYFGEDGYGVRYKLEGGLNYFISNSVALEPFVTYSLAKHYDPVEDDNSVSLGIRVSFYVIK